MSDTILPLTGIILVIFIGFKIFKKLFKVLILLVLILIAFILYNTMSDGGLSLEMIKSMPPPERV